MASFLCVGRVSFGGRQEARYECRRLVYKVLLIAMISFQKGHEKCDRWVLGGRRGFVRFGSFIGNFISLDGK